MCFEEGLGLTRCYRYLPSVAKITEEHLVFVRVVLALGADLALGTLPTVVSHILKKRNYMFEIF